MTFLLFWRCVVCPGKSSSCLPLTIQLRSPSFTFPPFFQLSPLSSSCSPPSLNIISDLLTKECGFSSSQVTVVMRRNPVFLRNKSDHTARKAIHLLKDLGFTEIKLKTAILRNPNFLLLKVNSQLKPKIEFLKKIGLASQDIVHIIFQRPRLLTLSLEDCLAPRILHLETLFGPKDHLCTALKRAPLLLISDFEKQVKAKVEYLKNSIGILEGSATLARGLDAILGLKFQTIEAKVKHMASLGLTEEEIAQILKVFPLALRYSTKKLKECIDFLVHTAGLQPGFVALNPLILGFSVEKRLKPRYELFKSLSTSTHVKGPPSLVRIFNLSEQNLNMLVNTVPIQLK